MAYTKTDFTLTAGFTPADVLDKLGEAFAAMGLMSNATDWYDSFTDTLGSEVRILRMVYNGDTYGTVYHAFVAKSSFDGIWYMMYYDWDVATHESKGLAQKDHAATFEHPDDTSYGNWTSYYACIDEFNNASDVTLSTFVEAGEIPWLFCATASGYRLIGFVPTTHQPTVARFDHNTLGPPSMLAANIQPVPYISGVAVLQRNIIGACHVDGASSNDWAGSVSVTGLADGGGVSESRLTGEWTGNEGGATAWALTPQGSHYNTDVTGVDSYVGILDSPLAINVYPDLATGPSFLFLQGWNNGAWFPSITDTLVVSSGVEEYFVVKASTPLSTSYGTWGANWYAFALRIV